MAVSSASIYEEKIEDDTFINSTSRYLARAIFGAKPVPLRRRLYIATREGRGMTIGAQRWAIAEGYIPGKRHGPAPQMESHETLCLLTAGARAAHVEIMVYFTDREPVGPYRYTVPARRTRHLRFNEFTDPVRLPRDTDFASVISADVPIVVQHTRLDTRQAELALLSTIAYAAG